MGRRPKKVDEGGEKGEEANTYQALAEIQELGFSQEEVIEMLQKAKREAAEAIAAKEIMTTTQSEAAIVTEGSGSVIGAPNQSRTWADRVEDGEIPIEERRKEDTGVQKTWADVARGNRNPENGAPLRYVKPGSVVKFSLAELSEGAKLWNNSLVGMIVGASPSYIEVAKYARAAWQGMGLGRVHQMQKGVFMFEFRSQAEKNRVLEGKWAIYNRYPLLLKNWQANVSIENHFDRIPIWIQLPNLNLDLWAPANLGKVASFVGFPVTTDECTAMRSRVDYARVLVEVPFMGELPDQIPIQDEDGPVYYQKVVYEWKPVVCGGCGWFGHDESRCKRKKEEKKLPIEVDEVVLAEEQSSKGRDEENTSKEVEKDEEIQGKGESTEVEKEVNVQTPVPTNGRGRGKQVVVSKTPILQNLPANVRNKKGVVEAVGKKNGGSKSSRPNG